jgi:hypothetical protein
VFAGVTSVVSLIISGWGFVGSGDIAAGIDAVN